MERLKGFFDVSICSLWSAGLNEPITISSSRLSSLHVVTVLLDRLRGALCVAGPVMSSKTGKSLVLPLSWLSTFSCAILVLLDCLRGALGEAGCVESSETGKSLVLPLSWLSTLSVAILVLLDRLRGALGVTGSMMS